MPWKIHSKPNHLNKRGGNYLMHTHKKGASFEAPPDVCKGVIFFTNLVITQNPESCCYYNTVNFFLQFSHWKCPVFIFPSVNQ
jgi:hypothetical protein